MRRRRTPTGWLRLKPTEITFIQVAMTWFLARKRGNHGHSDLVRFRALQKFGCDAMRRDPPDSRGEYDLEVSRLTLDAIEKATVFQMDGSLSLCTCSGYAVPEEESAEWLAMAASVWRKVKAAQKRRQNHRPAPCLC